MLYAIATSILLATSTRLIILMLIDITSFPALPFTT